MSIGAVRRLLPGSWRDAVPDAGDDRAKSRGSKKRSGESFTDYLPWMEYDARSQTILLEDGVSVGAVWEIEPLGTEGRTHAYKTAIRDKAFNLIADVIPELDQDPWVLQVYVQDDTDLSEFFDAHQRYRFGDAARSEYTRQFDEILARHLQAITRPGGLFEEDAGNRWRGRQRRVRFVLYRVRGKDRGAGELAPEDELNELSGKLEAAFSNAGVRIRRYTGRDFYHWMLPWFNPKPEIARGDPRRLRQVAPYPGDEELPFGRDFSELLCPTPPRISREEGCMYFDALPHTVVTTMGLRRAPALGNFTGEQSGASAAYTVFDRMPEHTVMALSVIFRPQDVIQNHVGRIEKAAVGDQTQAELAAEEAVLVKRKMGLGDKLYPVELVFYVRADNRRALRRACHQVATVLLAANITPIGREEELLLLDRYICNLPMRFRAADEKNNRRSRYVFASHLAAMLPIYGRTRGTGHPGILTFNGGGEPLAVDPLHKEDRKKNAHMLILGPTGAGKSAFLAWLLMQAMAIYRPRLYIIEAGNSFGLLADHFARHGLSVYKALLRSHSDVSLPPFADALRLLDQAAPLEQLVDDALLDESNELEDDDDLDAGRDILGEMEIAARIMITGGEEKEEARLSRADRKAIREAIYNAAVAAREAGKTIVLPGDVAGRLRHLADDGHLTDRRRDRLREMADSLALFADHHSLAGQLFNRPGSSWPDADVTLVDLGTLARDGYEGELALANVSLLSHINNLVEQHQADERQTLVVTDEGHLLTTNPLLVRYVVKITKMWRKLGAWYWLATQNLEDFPDAAKRMLNAMEWWFCLVMPREEVEQIARFKDLTDDAKRMLLSARKEPGKFIEGVLLSDTCQTKFRSVPPALALALPMTEKHEKAERREIVRRKGLAEELDAAYEVARRIEATR